jgi:ketosteroid isomerase-like protein
MSNVATVQSIYAAFGRGDIPAILAHLAEDVKWDPADPETTAQREGVPWLTPRVGRSEVGKFFEALTQLEFNAFEPYAFMADESRVATCVRAELTVKKTGKRIRDEEMHVWTFDASGKVALFRHVVDTGKHVEAWRA